MSMDTQEITRKLESLRKKADDFKQQKSKLEGEDCALQNRISDLEKQAKEEAGVEINDLPAMIKEYEDKITAYMQKIEKIMEGK